MNYIFHKIIGGPNEPRGPNGSNANSVRNNGARNENVNRKSSTNKNHTYNSSQQKTRPSSTATISSATTPTSLSLTRKIDPKHWKVVAWFGGDHHWQNDFVRWIILAIEEPKDSPEQPNIDTGLDIIKREIDEIITNWISPDAHGFYLDLIPKCKNFRSQSYNKSRRNELLDSIFNHLKVKRDDSWEIRDVLSEMCVKQRSILRFMTHQKVQARIAFLRTTLKTHNASYEMERYHCITNPYYAEVLKQKQMAINNNNDLQKELDKTNIELKELLKAKNRPLSQSEQTTPQKQKEENAIKEVIANYVRITKERDDFEAKAEEYKRLQEELIKQTKLAMENQSKEYDKMKSEYETKIKQLQKEAEETRKRAIPAIENYSKIVQKCEKMKLEYEAEIKQLQEETEELSEQAKSAKEEASNYQAALGNATNTRWSDNTSINPIQLTKDFEKLQHSLTDFTKVKGRSFKVYDDEAKQLLAKYDCNANLNTKEIKNYLSAALQRMILEIIFYNVENLIDYSNNAAYSDEYLESLIVYHTQSLVECTHLFAESREGQDTVTAITSVKIRQQGYAALGSRGFARSNHPFIKKLVYEILSRMEKYREVLDEEKKKELPSEAEKIIRTGMQLWFCLKAQEPIPMIHWFESGSHLKPHLMVGSWKNESVEEMEVDFTFFPLIITEHDNQIFTKAQVFTRPKSKEKLRK